MYLSLLSKIEKGLFLELAHSVSFLDGTFGIEEQQMLASYCREMDIPIPLFQNNSPMDSVVHQLASNSSMLIKKIVIFELVGLAMSDGRYDCAEKNFISSIVSKFGISNLYLSQCEAYISDYMNLQSKINTLVMDKSSEDWYV